MRTYELEVPAAAEQLPEVLAFIKQRLEEAGFPPKAQMQVAIAAEEIFINIAHYAYGPETGTATVRVEPFSAPAGVAVTFIDRGAPFDPLARPDPDVTLSAEERDVGGLGIFMTKKLMDDVSYEYRDGRNILQMRKNL